MNDSEKIKNEDEMSHKGEKLRPYSTKMKVEAVKYAEINGNRVPGRRKYAVYEKRIREWQKNKNKIASLMSMKRGQLRKRQDGAGVKPLSENLEESIMDWIIFRRLKSLRVSRKLVMKKALLTYQEIAASEGRAESVKFKASRGRPKKVMRRNNLSLRRKPSLAQKDPISSLLRVQEKQKYELAQIIAIDETPIWSNMVPATTIDATGKKTITMKPTGHEKSSVFVCLAAKAYGTKLKAMIVFKGAVRECKVLCQKSRTQAVIVSSPNGWMNTELTLQWVKNIVGTFSFKQRLLVLDSYECQIEGTIKKILATKKTDTAVVPGGLKCLTFYGTRYLKPSAQKGMMIGWLQKESIMKRKQTS